MILLAVLLTRLFTIILGVRSRDGTHRLSTAKGRARLGNARLMRATGGRARPVAAGSVTKNASGRRVPGLVLRGDASCQYILLQTLLLQDAASLFVFFELRGSVREAALTLSISLLFVLLSRPWCRGSLRLVLQLVIDDHHTRPSLSSTLVALSLSSVDSAVSILFIHRTVLTHFAASHALGAGFAILRRWHGLLLLTLLEPDAGQVVLLLLHRCSLRLSLGGGRRVGQRVIRTHQQSPLGARITHI